MGRIRGLILNTYNSYCNPSGSLRTLRVLVAKEERMKQQCEDDIHDWEYSSWGVIIGVSKCRKCGKVAKEKDFVVSANFEQTRKEK